MSEYTRSIATALRLITKRGQAVTLTTKTAGAYDTATGATAITETTQIGYGVVTEYNTKDIDGTLIKADDLLLILAASGVTTKPVADKTKATLLSGVAYLVKHVLDIAPSGESIVYKLQLRR